MDDDRTSILWYIKQLLPLQYRAVYVFNDNKYFLSIWRMWFGRCFAVKEYQITKAEYERRKGGKA